jgi:hypothetical protein
MEIYPKVNPCPLPASSRAVSPNIAIWPVLIFPQAFYISAKLSAMDWISQDLARS